jgi:predicted Zn-dependent peptidase
MLNARLDPDDVKKEKGVVLEEISMVEDSPEDVAHDLIAAANFGEEPLARTILGPAQNIAEATRAAIVSYKARFYTPGNAVLAIAGIYGRPSWRICAAVFASWQGGSAPREGKARPSAAAPFRDKVKLSRQSCAWAFDGVSQAATSLRDYDLLQHPRVGIVFAAISRKESARYKACLFGISYPSGICGRWHDEYLRGLRTKNVQAVGGQHCQVVEGLC